MGVAKLENNRKRFKKRDEKLEVINWVEIFKSPDFIFYFYFLNAYDVGTSKDSLSQPIL